MTRRLSLRREHLTELSPDELSALAGGNMDRTPLCTPPWFYEVRYVVTRAVNDALQTVTCWC